MLQVHNVFSRFCITHLDSDSCKEAVFADECSNYGMVLRIWVQHFLEFRIEVIERRAKYHLHRAQDREHIVKVSDAAPRRSFRGISDIPVYCGL